MATNDRNIGLRISARAEGLNDLQRVSEVLDRLEKSQQDFARSAGTAGRSLRELEGELRDLNRVAGSLNKLSALNDSLNNQRQVARDSVAQLRKAREELAKYVAENDKGTVGVREYNRQVKALQRQVDAADKAQASARKTAQQYSAQLRQLGLNSAEARDNLRALGAATERQLAAAQQNIRTFDQRVDRERQIAAEVQRRAAVEAQAAAAAKQADQERNRALEERKRRLEQATAVLRAESDRQLAAIRREAQARAAAERRAPSGFAAFSRAAGGAPARARQADADAAAAAVRAQREREITAEVQRRSAIEAQAAQARKREEEERNRLIRERQARLEQAVGVLRPTLDRQIGQETRTSQIAAARAEREEQRKVAAATNQNAKAQGGLAEALRKVAGQGRTTLDFYQRLRGQVLELVATYGSFFAAISTAQQAVTVSLERTAIENRLLFANNNDAQRTAEDLEFVRRVSDRLGQSFNSLATLYSRFAAASAAANQPIDRTRRIFEQLTEAFTVLGLSQADVEGSFRALEQSISKGSVQAEELRGQLGDRFPGAVQRFAKSIGVSVEELNKLLEAGRVSSAAIEFFAADIAAAARDTLPKATNSLRASLNRLRTAYEDFLVTIVNSGFGDELAKLSVQLAEFFRSEQGTQFGRTISEAFSTIVTAAKFLVENIDGVLLAFRLFAGYLAGRLFAAALAGAITGFAAIARILPVVRSLLFGTGAAATTAAVGVRTLTAALGPIAFALGIASTFLLEWFFRARDAERQAQELSDELSRLETARGQELATLRDLNRAQIDELRNQEEIIRKKREEAEARLAVARAADEEAQSSSRAAARSGAPVQFGNLSSRADLASARSEVEKLTDEERRIAEERRRREAADRASEQILIIDATTARINALAQAREIEATLNSEANKKLLAENDEFYDKFAKQIEDFEKQVETAQLGKTLSASEADRLQRTRDAAVGARLSARNVIRPGGAAGDKSAQRAVDEREREITRLTEQAEEERARARRDALQRQTEDEETAAEARVELIKLEYQQKIAEQRKYQQEATALGQTALAAQFGANISALEGEQEAAIALEQRKTAIDTTRTAYEKLDQALQNTIAKRDAELERIATERELGLITQQQAELAADRVTQEYQPQILANLQALRDFIEANADVLGKMFNVEEILLQLDSLQLKTETVVTAGQRRAQELKESFAQGAAQALSSLGTGIADAIRGFSSFGDAIKGARDAFLNFAADFLIQIGQMILQQAILNALQNSGSSVFQSIGNLLAGGARVGSAHTGAIVGKGFPNYRNVSPALFANAPRYHSGGIVGLKPDEVPAILQTGEEVLARNDPRNAMNGGKGGANVQIVNAIDAESVVAAGMQGNAGRQIIMNVIQANKSAFRQVLAS